jgi:hypothetical protein
MLREKVLQYGVCVNTLKNKINILRRNAKYNTKSELATC